MELANLLIHLILLPDTGAAFNPCRPPQKLINKYQSCLRESGMTPPAGCNVSLLDASGSRPRFYILDDRGKCILRSSSTIGKNSKRYRPPRAGNRSGSRMTPAGLFMTKRHNGYRYQQHNSIGISGRNSENSRTVSRGVIIHGSSGNTWGCVGVPHSVFRKIKRENLIQYGCPHFNFFKNGRCGDENKRVENLDGTLSEPPRRVLAGKLANPVEELDLSPPKEAAKPVDPVQGPVKAFEKSVKDFNDYFHFEQEDKGEQ